MGHSTRTTGCGMMPSLMQLPVYTYIPIHQGVYKWVLYSPLIESSLKFPKEPYLTQADDLNHIELLHTSGGHYDCIGTEDEGLPPLTLPNISKNLKYIDCT